jgi:hypothetical protein
MGAVYRVVDTRDGGEFALKLLSPHGSVDGRQRLTEMFSREYRTLAQLAHPSVIRVHDYGLSDAGPYYTMELLSGQDLHAAAPVPWREACRYAHDVCSSLSLLHSRRLLHRDVSPRNVRCTSGGGAKLIDFGAMVTMGTGHPIVGTPPLMSPEVFHQQDLDGRCDLFALGATLYWALTGRHAYPARTLSQLPRVWKDRPAPPSALAHDVPDTLDAVVLSLLALEPEARPRSASEVMDRLGAIAGLEEREHVHVPMAYLTAPALVGRDVEISTLRAAMRTAAAGRSVPLFVTGAPGVGRSRMLDTAALEARLQGAAVLRLQASDVAPGAVGIARSILHQAHLILPSEGGQSRTRQVAVDATADDAERVSRSRLVSRVRAVVRGAAAMGTVVIAVDDAHELDGGSQALLATLTGAARRRLVLLLSTAREATLDPALEALRLQSRTLELEPLAPAQTERLLSSVFGAAPGVAPVATRVHALSAGNPRATMELAQHLVDRNVIRYERGGWALPARLERAELPGGWTEAIDVRLDALADDERDLAEALAVALDRVHDPAGLDALTTHGRTDRREVALDGLVAAGILRVEGGRYAFTSSAVRQRLDHRMAPERRKALSGRLGRLLQRQGADAIEVARCHLEAGEQQKAIDTLLSELASGSRWDTAPSDYADLLQRALREAERADRPRRDLFNLRMELVRVGEHLGVPDMGAHFAWLFEQLREDGCLAAYEALPDSLDPAEKLSQSLAKTQQRWDGLPERDRVLPPIEGIRVLSMTARQASAFAAVSMDHELWCSMPDLRPLVPLSPAIEVSVHNTLPAAAHLNAARFEEAYRCYCNTLERLQEPNHAGLDDEFWTWAVAALNFALGHIQAGLGLSKALEYADHLATLPAWESAAWNVRRAYHLRQGDLREADNCRARMERLQLESGRRPPMVDTSARLELDTAAHAGDLVAARRAVQRMRHLIDTVPGYAPYAHYGPAVRELLRGNHWEALQRARDALDMVTPGEHPTWPWIASCELEALLGLERYEEARERALEHLERADEIGLRIMAHHITLPLAHAEAHLGELDSAMRRVEEALAYREQLGCRGLNLGWVHEYRARIAILARDYPTFLAAAERCAEEYGKGRGGSTLVAKYEALRAEARNAGMGTPSMLPKRIEGDETTVGTVARSTLYSALEAATPGERFMAALSLLLEESGATAGVLYRVTESGLTECASKPGPEPPAEDQLAGLAALPLTLDTLDTDDEVTRTAIESGAVGEGPRWLPSRLGYYRGVEGFRPTGVALLYFEDEPGALPLEVVEAVGRILQAAERTVTR